MQLVELAPQRLTRRQHRLRDPLQHGGVPAHQLADTRRQFAAAHITDLEPEAAQQPAQGLLQIHGLDLHLLAGNQQSPHFLRGD